jgi:hypothetical protein
MWKLGLVLIITGIVIILALLGSSAKNLFSGAIIEDVPVKLKNGNDCIVEPSDKIPRVITNCNFNVGDNLSVTYKIKQPSIEKFELKDSSVPET